jgi:hypothetical protein
MTTSINLCTKIRGRLIHRHLLRGVERKNTQASPPRPRVATGRNPNSPAVGPSPTPPPLSLLPEGAAGRSRSAQAAARPSHPPARWGGRGFPPSGQSLDLPPGCWAGGAPLGVDATGGGQQDGSSGGGHVFRLDLAARGGEISSDGSSSAAVVEDLPPASGGAPAPMDGSAGLTRVPPGLGRACGAGSMAARGVAAPRSSGLLASWWCR